MKKIFIILFISLSSTVNAFEKITNFTFEKFNEAKNSGKTIVVNSWNKFCGTCAQQTKIINEAKKEFPNVIFLSYEQKHKDIANFLKIDYPSSFMKNISVKDKFIKNITS